MSNKDQSPLPWVLSDDELTVVLPEGKSATLTRENGSFDTVLEAIREGRWDEVPALMDTSTRIHDFSGGKFEVRDGEVYINDVAVPDALSDKIIEYAEQDLPCDALLKFWDNLNENPSYRAVEQLYGFLLKNKHPITSDGCFIAYKRVRANLKDVYTNKIDNSPGAKPEMPRNKVNEDPNMTCSYGLHVANWYYAHDVYSGEVMVMVKVHPRDVVAVPVDYGQSKMRVCKYEVLEVVEEEKKTPYLDVSRYDNEDDLDEYEDEDKDYYSHICTCENDDLEDCDDCDDCDNCCEV